MRAVVQHRFGGPDVLRLEDVPRPAPLPTEVLVRVHAAGVNPVDWKTRAGGGMARVLGDPTSSPTPFVLGWDVSGVVEQVGFGVTTLAPGDAVYGMPWFPRAAGAYAEYVTAPARQWARKPATIDHAHAAAVPLAALTAWQALVDTADLRPGQRVLVHAAAGGVGHFAVQFAKHLGAHVIGTASGGRRDWLAALGVDEVVDYTAVRFEDVVRDADVVLDLVGDGHDRTSTRSLGVLRPGGLLVAIPGGVSPDLAAAARARGVRATPYLVEPDGPALARIAALIDGGTVSVEVEEVFPLAAAAEIGFEAAVAVVDATGALRAFARGDGAPFLTADVAVDKAWTAASFGYPTHVWNAYVTGDPKVGPLAHFPRMMAVGGGYPLLDDGRLVGGIGISGGSYQQDQDAAERALAALGFTLPG